MDAVTDEELQYASRQASLAYAKGDEQLINNILQNEAETEAFNRMMKEKSEEPLKSNYEIEREKEQALFDYAEKNNLWETNTEELALSDRDYRQNKYRKAIHDLNYIDSMENHAIELVKRIGNEDAKKLFNINEAREYAKEQGLTDWNAKDRETISKYDLDLEINREKLRQTLQQEIALYNSYGDYTRLNQLGQLASAISGGMGAAELAVTVGLGWLTGWGAAAGLARLASLFPKSVGVLRGVQIARQIELTQKAIKTQEAFRKEILEASRFVQQQSKWNKINRVIANKQKALDIATGAIEKEGWGAKLGYDTYRFGRTMQLGGPGHLAGSAGSLATTVVPFAFDGAISMLPHIGIQSLHSNVLDTQEYTPKDALVDMITGMTLEGAMPVIGRAALLGGKAGKVPVSMAWKQVKAAENKVKGHINEKKAQAIYKNYEADIEKAIAENKNVDEFVPQLLDEIKKRFPSNTLEIAQAMKDFNGTPEEIATRLSQEIETMTMGIQKESQVPIRTQWMSTVPQIYDIGKKVIDNGGTVDDVFKAWQDEGLKIIKNGKFGKEQNEAIEFIKRLEQAHLDAEYYFKGEAGYLGSKKVKGLSFADAENIFKHLYVAHLYPDSKIGKQALQYIKMNNEKLYNTIAQLRNIVSRYNEIAEINKTYNYDAAKKLVGKFYKPGKFGQALTQADQANLYTLMNGSKSSVSVAISDALQNLLPDTLLEKYNKAHEILSSFRNNEILKGHVLPSDKQTYKEAKDFIEKLNEDLHNLFVENINIKNVNKAGQEYTTTITRLAPFKYGKSALTGEAKATETAQIDYLIKQLQEIADNNKVLIDAEEEYKKLIPDPEKFIEDNPYQTRLNTSEAERKMQQRSYDANNVHRLLNDNNAKTERYKTYQLEAESRINKAGSKEGQENIVIGTYKTILSALSKSEKAQGKLGAYRLLKIKDNIELYNKILGDNFTTFRNNIMSKIKESEVFKELLANPKLGKITETNMDWTIPRYRQEFKNIFTKAFKETVNENDEYIKAFGSIDLDKWTDEVLDNFSNYLKENPEKGMQELMTSHTYDAAVNTAEEASQVMAQQVEQEEIIENMMKPFMEQVAYTAMDRQVLNYQDFNQLYDFLEECINNPGQIDEILLGKITMTPIINKGSSISTEALSSLDSEWQQFVINLRNNDATAIKDGTIPQEIAKNKDFVPLQVYAFDSKNFKKITEAIYNSIRLLEGDLSDEEAMLLKRQNNTRAYRVAKEYLNSVANVKQLLYEVGSNKNKIVNLCDMSKMKELQYYLSKNMTETNMYKNIQSFILNNAKEENAYHNLTKYFERFDKPMGTSKAELAEHNANLDLFNKLDLNKTFKNTKYNLNEIRDAVISGNFEQFIENRVAQNIEEAIKKNPKISEEIKKAIREKTIKNIEQGCKKIEEGFFGKPGEDLGLLNKLRGDVPFNQDPLKASYRAKYVEDIQEKLFYKNSQAALEDFQYFGYDNFKSLFEGTIGAGRKAYAVLKNLGSEPVQQTEAMIEMAKAYANTIAPKAHGLVKAKKLSDKLSPTWERAVRFNLHNVCGTYTIPANNFQKWAQIIIRLVSSPMLMSAGFRSITDYNYQLQSLVNMGLASQGDLLTRGKVWGMAGRWFTQDKDFHDQIFMMQTIRNDVLHSMQYNTSLGSGDILGSVLYKKGRLNKYAPTIMKAEQLSKWYSTHLLDNIAWIGPLTNYNRTNAALTTMKAIGAHSEVSYKQMNEYLQQTLKRFDISEYEWDNILSKKIVTNARDYIQQMSGEVVPEQVSNYKMFFPEMVDKISDKELTKFMQDQKLVITDLSKQKYRQYLKDKASLLINSSADEMTSIPSSRIQGMMSVHNLQNTAPAFVFNTALQFQSFGAAINYYQMARRIAAHTTGDATFDTLLGQLIGHPSIAKTIPQFIAESALCEFVIGEMIKELKGNNRKLVNDQGEFQGDVLLEKTVDSIGASIGLGNLLTQGIMSGLMKASGKGGGMAIPVLPSLSHLVQAVERVTSAATKESTKDSRGKAIAGAIGQNLADMLGFPNQPFAYATWGLIIGDTFKEWQYGDRYEAVQTQRAHRGYAPSWVRRISENIGLSSPGDSSLVGNLFGW